MAATQLDGNNLTSLEHRSALQQAPLPLFNNAAELSLSLLHHLRVCLIQRLLLGMCHVYDTRSVLLTLSVSH